MRNTTAAEKSTWIAQLRSHELHIKLDYGLRLGVLALAILALLIGAVMVFTGLPGSFDWTVEAPHAISARLTNASPGIVFATIGLILGIVSVLLPPIKFQTGDDGTLAIHQPFLFARPSSTR